MLRMQRSSVRVQRSSARVQRSSVGVQRSSRSVQRGLVGSALVCCIAGLSSNLGWDYPSEQQAMKKWREASANRDG